MAAFAGRKRQRKKRGAAEQTTEPIVVVAALFVFMMAALGGSSRYDAMQLAILLPIACLAAGYGLLKAWDKDWRELRTPLIVLLLWTGLCLLQLIPLPPDLWRALSGRGPMTLVADAIGDRDWRPLSMVPWRTQHALWMMAVPLSTLFVWAALDRKAMRFAIVTMIAIALASALLGILQASYGESSVLHYYKYSDPRQPVGLFANPNHAAIFGAASMILIAGFARIAPRPQPSWVFPSLGVIYFTLLMFQLINGSRGGLALTALALGCSGMLFVIEKPRSRTKRGGSKLSNLLRSHRFSIAVPLVVISVVLLFLLYLADRMPALQRLSAAGPLDDLRFRVTPILVRMVGDFFPWGSGFGSFEDVFYAYETNDVLIPSYLNQAHDDWLQVVIEGGLPATALLIAGLLWIARTLIRLWQSGRQGRIAALCGAGITTVLILGSGFDYPLRTPLFQMVAILLLGILAHLPATFRDRQAGEVSFSHRASAVTEPAMEDGTP